MNRPAGLHEASPPRCNEARLFLRLTGLTPRFGAPASNCFERGRIPATLSGHIVRHAPWRVRALKVGARPAILVSRARGHAGGGEEREMSTSAGERVRDLVVLIPGFLGFDHFGSFPYFAQTVGTAIRVALEMRGRRGLAVVPSQTVPAGSLADRQRHLLASLEAAVAYYAARKGSTLPRLHLVGHSTGGVDAELFTYRQALDGTPWSARENELRACLRSIVTVASPLQGTWLAESPLARWLGQGSHLPKDVSDALDWRAARDGLEGALQFGRALWALPACLRGDSVPFALLGGAAADLHPFVRFVGSLARHRELLVELRPDAMKTTVAVDKRDPWLSHVRRKSFVTVAALGKAAPAGRFFRLLHGLASAPRMAARDVERMASLLDRLVEDDGVAIVRSPRVPEISIDA